MTLSTIISLLELEIAEASNGLDGIVRVGYIGDLLSHVMSHVRRDTVWFTVQNHVNSVAVASMTGIVAIVLVDAVEASDEMKVCARREGIPILASKKSSFELAGELARYLNSKEISKAY